MLQPIILDELFHYDGLQGYCTSCLHKWGEYRCINCTTPLLYCSPCIVSQHENVPLHCLGVQLCFSFFQMVLSHIHLGLDWRFFSVDIPTQLGSHLLHQSPAHCLSICRLKRSSYSCINTNGAHHINVQFCMCIKDTKWVEKYHQLLRVG